MADGIINSRIHGGNFPARLDTVGGGGGGGGVSTQSAISFGTEVRYNTPVYCTPCALVRCDWDF